jgi:hypothetical protein
LGIHSLKAYDDAVVNAQNIVGKPLHFGNLLVSGIATLIALEMEDESAHIRLPDFAEDTPRIDVHSRSKRGVEVQAVVVGEAARPCRVFPLVITTNQGEVRGKK